MMGTCKKIETKPVAPWKQPSINLSFATSGDRSDYFRFSTLLDGSVDTITDFDVANDKIVLDDAIFTALAGQTSVGDFIKYDKDTGKLTYDADGAGVGNAIHFATLTAGLDEDQIQYQII